MGSFLAESRGQEKDGKMVEDAKATYFISSILHLHVCTTIFSDFFNNVI